MDNALAEAIRTIIRDEISTAIKDAIDKAIRERRIPTAPPQTIYLKGSTSEVKTLFPVTAVAAMLEVSAPWVYDRIKTGEIKAP